MSLLVVWFVACCCLALFWSLMCRGLVVFFAGGSDRAGTLKAKFILFNCDITGDRCASSCRRNFLIDSLRIVQKSHLVEI